jgi:hypothetical protein
MEAMGDFTCGQALRCITDKKAKDAQASFLRERTESIEG